MLIVKAKLYIKRLICKLTNKYLLETEHEQYLWNKLTSKVIKYDNYIACNYPKDSLCFRNIGTLSLEEIEFLEKVYFNIYRKPYCNPGGDCHSGTINREIYEHIKHKIVFL